MVRRPLLQSSFQTALEFYSRFKQKLKNSDQNKIDNTCIEYAIFSLFRINLVENIKIKAALAKQFHIQPSELDKMYFWEYELFIMQINDLVKSENDQQKAEMDKYHVGEYMNMANPRNMQKMMNKGMNMPKMPNMDMSSVKI